MAELASASREQKISGHLSAIAATTQGCHWDARNHLSAISGPVDASFTYDAFGRRASKTIAGTETQLLYDILNPVQELQAGTPSGNLLDGLNIDEYFARTDSNNNLSTLLQDALGSTIGLVGAGQSIATSYTYQPFGATTVGGAANGNSYQFTGRENDGTGLYSYRARYYSPTYQRFVSQDPIGFAGGDSNLYAYAKHNPISFLDPNGLETGWVSLESSQNPPPFEPPDVSVGIDSPLGGVETTFPFHSGGNPTTVTNGPSLNFPIPFPPGSNACVRGQFGPEPGQVSLDVNVSTPLGGVDSTINVNNAAVTEPGYSSPQINFPIGPGVNGYIGFRY
ncbi:MAG: RHS repeat-associated core domain-containing protein [Candidatus Binataceae bacterium]